ncbi:hypothetical protein L2E82_06610 [Cichorium intybus]|uniref:Uncharacterized protein n=1 Tax=Cichorium intybus TaxID=13427 RepID=A0ACB9HAY5_CICIN|nr:hypothetical protein L2E82_06610 [Cichorium intybus]
MRPTTSAIQRSNPPNLQICRCVCVVSVSSGKGGGGLACCRRRRRVVTRAVRGAHARDWSAVSPPVGSSGWSGKVGVRQLRESGGRSRDGLQLRLSVIWCRRRRRSTGEGGIVGPLTADEPDQCAHRRNGRGNLFDHLDQDSPQMDNKEDANGVLGKEITCTDAQVGLDHVNSL